MELSLDDISKYLGVALNTVQRWVRQGKMPIQRKGANYTFRKQDLQKWASNNNLILSFDKEAITEVQDTLLPSLSDALKNGGIYYNVSGDNVETALKAALNAIDNIPLDLKNELFGKLMERENVLSTGVGNGIAIPHPRAQSDKLESSMLSICFLENPIEYNALDNKPVSVLFILLCQSLEIHLHVLSTLSFCLRNNAFVSFLKTAPDHGLIFEKIEAFQNEMS
ncbi:MAG: PTS sugar transporter subunit IIA [Desulfobacteraceae bacterium]|nr:PTS sugar transporter subunit IIA [Desulfobacteraceae bacterium]